MFKLLLLFIVLSIITNVNCQSPDCNCDLKQNECDINCCCDIKCTPWDLNSFNCPTSQNTNNIDKKWCVPQSALYTSNVQFKTKNIEELFCVYPDDSSVRNFYNPPLPQDGRLSSKSVDYLINLISNSQNKPSSYYQSLNSQKTSFDSSDYVWIIYKDNNLGYFNLPQINVNNPLPLRYLQNRNIIYTVSSDKINKECSATSTSSPTSLSLAYFFDNFKIIKAPNSLSECNKQNAQNFTVSNPSFYDICKSSTYTTEIKIRKCIGSDGKLINKCSEDQNIVKPVISNGKCTNLVKNIVFLFKYTTKDGIIDTAMDITFYEDTSPSTASLEQNFKVYFTESDLANFDYSVKLNGNPGYDDGEFIKVGETESNFASNSLSYLKADVNGNCVNGDDREFVKFQYSIQSACVLKKTPPDLNSLNKFCSDLQDEIDSIILGKTSALYFSQYSDKTKSKSKAIINSNRANLPKPTPLNTDGLGGLCQNVRYGANIRIAYALNGNIYGPVFTIEYISYKWDKVKDVNTRCSDQLCANNEIQIVISTQVEYIDVSQSPLYSETNNKRAIRTKPGDFFFALTSSSNRQLYYRIHIFSLLALFIFML